MNAKPKPKRLSLSEILELVLTRHTGDRSSVTIARTAAGETTFEVKVRPGETDEVPDIDAALDKAVALHSDLENLYPRRLEHEAGSVSLTRNAKGETQIDVDTKTTAGGRLEELEQAETAAAEAYDRLRRRYPLATGTTEPRGKTK